MTSFELVQTLQDFQETHEGECAYTQRTDGIESHYRFWIVKKSTQTKGSKANCKLSRQASEEKYEREKNNTPRRNYVRKIPKKSKKHRNGHRIVHCQYVG